MSNPASPQTKEAVWLWRIIVGLLSVISAVLILLGGLVLALWNDLKTETRAQVNDVRAIRESVIRLEANQWTATERAELTAWRLGIERRITQMEHPGSEEP